jgi:endonuclease/exonuclease/phosphatase family metal-dependent hydrolase
MRFFPGRWILGFLFLACFSWTATAVEFRIVSYNLENYLDQPTESRRFTKSDEAKAQIRTNLKALKPDVIALQEVGQPSALLELQASLKAEGLDLPHHEFVRGWDTNIHVCVLSKFPIVARRPHTNDTYLLSGRRFRVCRGFAEVDIQPTGDYKFTLLVAHLKSRRPIPDADEAEMRTAEAKLLRAKVDARIAADPNVNLVVCGDLNDNFNTDGVKTVVGRGKNALVDTRPAERNGDNQPNPTNPRWSPRNVAWTHYYGVEDTYSRLDYILVSPGMAWEWVKRETYALTQPNWGIGSDHRPIVATFDTHIQTRDR